MALVLTEGLERPALRILTARALRAFCDGYVAILLPAYLLALGYGTLEVGVLSSATLFGSALATLGVGAIGHRFDLRVLLRAAAVLMALTGAGFALFESLWLLLAIAFAGTINPSSGDVSVFSPLEQAALAGMARDDARTALFARYSLAGSVFAALGAIAAALPEQLHVSFGVAPLDALRSMFVLYAAAGALVWWLYGALRQPRARADAPATASLGASRPVVFRLAALFSIDAFAGGLIVNSLLALWLFKRFGLSLSDAGAFFFCSSVLAALSYLVAVPLARRFGLLNTMVFTHIPSSACLILAALVPNAAAAIGLLLARSALSQMDVPTRTAYVMGVVSPAERPAAASVTSVPRSLAAAASPALAGAMIAGGALAAPLLACGALKIAYDLLLWSAFRRVKLRE
ncbi:MAG: MFS transporter [Betaproteobacteria bacterium]|nr:MFS transporter [Betaproteobacteria bacterium]